ncbi:MAG: C1 family peptidase [Kiloniellales bacterium]|nr:C1 family peptidase [Kiloniellales bacterium]
MAKKDGSGKKKDSPAKATGGPIVARATGGPIVPRASGGPIVPRAVGGGPRTVGGRPAVYMGWTPDLPDIRDLTLDTPRLVERLKRKNSKVLRTDFQLDSEWDNSKNCSPVEDQESLGSCTAQAAVGMLEYMMRRAQQTHVDGSRLFVYKVTRKLLGWTGDTGAYLRSAMQAIATFGMPPETFFPYDIARFEEEPDAFLYAFAGNYKALDYTRLDPPGRDGAAILLNVKHALRARFTVMFGFSVYSSISGDADVPYPTNRDKLTGGHAVLAVGYDDDWRIGDCKGAIKFKNSWGTGWGDGGYGFLPYKYIEQGLARDFWTVFNSDWIDTGRFR